MAGLIVHIYFLLHLLTIPCYILALRFHAISFDDEPPQIINMHEQKVFQDWEESVSTNTTVEISKHTLSEPGTHVLKFWMVDPGVVLQKLVIETGVVKPSYLGPPESFNRAVKTTERSSQ